MKHRLSFCALSVVLSITQAHAQSSLERSYAAEKNAADRDEKLRRDTLAESQIFKCYSEDTLKRIEDYKNSKEKIKLTPRISTHTLTIHSSGLRFDSPGWGGTLWKYKKVGDSLVVNDSGGNPILEFNTKSKIVFSKGVDSSATEKRICQS